MKIELEIRELLRMIVGDDTATQDAWLSNHNTALDAVPRSLLWTQDGKEKVRSYLISRTSLGR